MINNKIYIISSPSGGGKSSIIEAFLKKHSKCFRKSISHTTRTRRNLEHNGIHYYFVSEKNFKIMIKKNEFIEYAKVFDNYYGTSKKQIVDLINKGFNVILEIDFQGAINIRNIFKNNCLSIFIMPPSLKILYHRLKSRAQDSDKIINNRMKQANHQMIYYSQEYDHIIVNKEFDKSVQSLEYYLLK